MNAAVAAAVAGALAGTLCGWIVQDRRPCGTRWYRRAHDHAWNQILAIPRDGGRVELAEVLDIVCQNTTDYGGILTSVAQSTAPLAEVVTG